MPAEAQLVAYYQPNDMGGISVAAGSRDGSSASEPVDLTEVDADQERGPAEVQVMVDDNRVEVAPLLSLSP